MQDLLVGWLEKQSAGIFINELVVADSRLLISDLCVCIPLLLAAASANSRATDVSMDVWRWRRSLAGEETNHDKLDP